MAKKLYNPEVSPTAVQIAAISQRLAAMQLTKMRVPARARKIQTLRRQLPVTMIPNDPQPVIIRQSLQNLGSAVSETQPVQSPPA